MFSQRCANDAARGVPRGARAVSRCTGARARSGTACTSTRYEDVLWALKHPEVFSSKDVVNVGNDVPLLPLSVDPPDHAKYRRLLDPQFSPKRMAELDTEARKLVNEIIDAFVDARRVRVPRGVRDAAAVDDLPRAHGPAAVETCPTSCGGATTRSGPSDERDARGGASAAARRRARRSRTTSRTAIEEKRRNPDDRLLSTIVHGEVDGRPMTHDELHRYDAPVAARRARHRHRDARLHDRVPREPPRAARAR